MLVHRDIVKVIVGYRLLTCVGIAVLAKELDLTDLVQAQVDDLILFHVFDASCQNLIVANVDGEGDQGVVLVVADPVNRCLSQLVVWHERNLDQVQHSLDLVLDQALVHHLVISERLIRKTTVHLINWIRVSVRLSARRPGFLLDEVFVRPDNFRYLLSYSRVLPRVYRLSPGFSLQDCHLAPFLVVALFASDYLPLPLPVVL